MSNASMSIPEEVIDTVLKRHDIVDIVGRYVSLAKQGKNHRGLCPFHSERTPSFNVSQDKQIFKCFGCGKGGNAIQFIMEIDQLTFPEAVRMLAEEINLTFHWQQPAAELTPVQIERNHLLEAHELSALWFHNVLLNTGAGKPAMDYLISRGFTHKMIETFQIGYAPPMRDKLAEFLLKRNFPLELMDKGGLLRATDQGYVDLFRDRIIFPIHDAQGKVIAFAGRVLGDGQPKYLNTPETPLFNKSRSLYNYHRAKADIRKTRKIVLFEGYADVIKAWEAGVQNGVAVMGTAFTEQHAAFMERLADEVIICYDGDDAGQAAAENAIPMLEARNIAVRIARLPARMDPDDYIKQHGQDKFVREIIEPASAVPRFRLDRLRGQHSLKDESGKLQYLRESVQLIAKLSSPLEREHYLQDLGTEFHYPMEALKQECNEIRQEIEKKKRIRDKNDNSWNNVMNNDTVAYKAPILKPAFHNAERNLLAAMMHDPQITSYVEMKLGAAFNVDAHIVLAAYIYAFYAEHQEANIGKLITQLDPDIRGLASELSFLYSKEAATPEAVDDYIKEIHKLPQQRLIEEKKKQLLQAERTGDVILASQIGIEIITLERQLKSIH